VFLATCFCQGVLLITATVLTAIPCSLMMLRSKHRRLKEEEAADGESNRVLHSVQNDVSEACSKAEALEQEQETCNSLRTLFV